MKKLLLVALVTCLLTGCGSKDVEERLSALENEVATLKTENATLSAKPAEIANNNEDEIASTPTVYIDDSDATPEPTSTSDSKPYVYDWGEYPDFVYNDDVVDYYVNWDRDKLTVITLDGVDVYTGDDTPSSSWKVDGITEDSYMWYFDEVESRCLLTENAVVMLKDDGETEVFLDNVVGYGGWDCLVTVYQLHDGVLSIYEQTSNYTISKLTVATDVAEVDVYRQFLGEFIFFRKNDGSVYHFDPHDWDDDVEWEDWNSENSNWVRLLAGDDSVLKPLRANSLEYYRTWLEDYKEWFDTTDDPDALYPLPALLAEFSVK